MPARFRFALFDFDGTLADSYQAITASVNHVRSLHGLSPMTEKEVRGRVGHGLLRLMAEIVPGGDPAKDTTAYMEHHPSVMFEQTYLLPAVAETLAQFQAAGVRMAVCSNKAVSITRRLLQHLRIGQYFEAALGPEDSGKPKPDPGMPLLALAKLNATAIDALYVGDMPVDIETARAAQIPVWVVATGSSSREELLRAKPDQVFPDMSELAKFFFGPK